MAIIDLLPFLDGWSYKSYDYNVLRGQPVIVIKPGAEQVLIEEKNTRGYLLVANLQFTTPFASMRITARTPLAGEEFDFGVSPIELLAAGLYNPNNIQFWNGNPQMVPNAGTIIETALPQALATTAVTVWPGYPLSIRAPSSNKGKIYIGNSIANAAAGVGTPLDPGDSTTIKDVGLLSHILTTADFVGDKLIYLHEIPDAINGDSAFALNLTPAFPLPYSDGFQLKCENPSVFPISQIPGSAPGAQNTVSASVYYYNAVFIKINNESAFRKSLQALTGGRF